MNKKKFLLRLKRALRGCAPAEIQNRLAFYAEMIDDRMEEGLTEKDAVLEIGAPEKIADEILSEMKAEGKEAKRPLGTGAKILIALGSPVWLSLVIAVFAVVFSLAVSALAIVFSLFVCLFAVLISLCAVGVSLGVSGAACIVGSVVCAFTGRIPEALMIAGTGFVLLALGVIFFHLCRPAGKWILRAMEKTWSYFKKAVFRRRATA